VEIAGLDRSAGGDLDVEVGRLAATLRDGPAAEPTAGLTGRPEERA